MKDYMVYFYGDSGLKVLGVFPGVNPEEAVQEAFIATEDEATRYALGEEQFVYALPTENSTKFRIEMNINLSVMVNTTVDKH